MGLPLGRRKDETAQCGPQKRVSWYGFVMGWNLYGPHDFESTIPSYMISDPIDSSSLVLQWCLAGAALQFTALKSITGYEMDGKRGDWSHLNFPLPWHVVIACLAIEVASFVRPSVRGQSFHVQIPSEQIWNSHKHNMLEWTSTLSSKCSSNGTGRPL